MITRTIDGNTHNVQNFDDIKVLIGKYCGSSVLAAIDEIERQEKIINSLDEIVRYIDGTKKVSRNTLRPMVTEVRSLFLGKKKAPRSPIPQSKSTMCFSDIDTTFKDFMLEKGIAVGRRVTVPWYTGKDNFFLYKVDTKEVIQTFTQHRAVYSYLLDMYNNEGTV